MDGHCKATEVYKYLKEEELCNIFTQEFFWLFFWGLFSFVLLDREKSILCLLKNIPWT